MAEVSGSSPSGRKASLRIQLSRVLFPHLIRVTDTLKCLAKIRFSSSFRLSSRVAISFVDAGHTPASRVEVIFEGKTEADDQAIPCMLLFLFLISSCRRQQSSRRPTGSSPSERPAVRQELFQLVSKTGTEKSMGALKKQRLRLRTHCTPLANLSLPLGIQILIP